MHAVSTTRAGVQRAQYVITQLLIFCKSAVVTLYGREQAGVGTIYTGIRAVATHTELSCSDALYRPVPHAL
eukprot:SAG22_NODE_1341_length_4687_cov_1.078030_4_plen_71_part_00